MILYILKRILWMIPVLLGVTLIVFLLMRMNPVDPSTLALSINATETEREAWRDERGLNDPLPMQFAKYCYDVFIKFDFGKSYSTGRSISQEILTRLPRTLMLTLFALIIGQGIGVPIGIVSAVKQYSLTDNVVMIVALLGISMPAFWSGLMLSLLFSLKLGWLPASGFYGPIYWVLPSVTLALFGIGTAARMTRSCMLDVIRQDYITTARAKGLSEGSIIGKHALKNALVPILTQTGIGACTMLGGAMVVEMVFSVPGIGIYMVNSIKTMDYPAVLGCVLVVAFAASVVLLVIDLCYAFADPRIRAQYRSKKIRTKGAKA